MKKTRKLLFGTAGIPTSTNPYNTIKGIQEVKRLGLGAMELEFVRSINISEEKAPIVKQKAAQNKIILTCHGQYFINLNALEQKKLIASKKRIISAARRAFQCGGWSICFHPAFYMKQDPKKVFEKVKINLKEVVQELKNDGIGIWVRPETAGKISQFGTLEELLDISSQLENVMPCIDFSHLQARSNGKKNSFKEFSSTLELVEKKLGKSALQNMHIHAQGVEFNEKGERRHLPFSEASIKYTELARAFKEFRVKGVVICESPLMEKDTKKLFQAYKSAK